MSQIDQEKLEALQESLSKLQNSRKTILLSTVTSEGFPEISYAPYVRNESGQFFIFISELASHTQNIMNTAKASVMFINEESESRNLFARERLIYQCSSIEVDNESDLYHTQLDAMEAEFGNMISMLRTLKDFHLFCLEPERGSYVVGFGKAYDVDPVSGTLIHIDEEKLKQGKG